MYGILLVNLCQPWLTTVKLKALVPTIAGTIIQTIIGVKNQVPCIYPVIVVGPVGFGVVFIAVGSYAA
jgi:hypothetical protein